MVGMSNIEASNEMEVTIINYTIRKSMVLMYAITIQPSNCACALCL